MAEQKESTVSQEMIESAKRSLEETRKRAEQEAETPADLSAPRRRSQRQDVSLEASDIPAPKLEEDQISPTAFAAVPVGGKAESIDEQEFYIDAAKLEFLHFTKPGQNLPRKRLYTVKAIHQDGRLVQLPFEPQINNTAGGDIEDAIGLRRFTRKGIKVLFNFDTMQPVYCAAWGCWARADGQTGFCSMRHAQHTLPNRFREARGIIQGLMEQGVTTSRVWDSGR